MCQNCHKETTVERYGYGLTLTHIAMLCTDCAAVLERMGMRLRKQHRIPVKDYTGWIKSREPLGVA